MILAFFACYIPVLETPEDTAPVLDWSAPENQWPSATPPSSTQGEGYEQGQIITDYAFFDQYGDDVSLWQFYGNVILFDVSAEWCAPCKMLAEEVQAAQDDYADQGFVYVSYLAEGNLSQEPVTVDILSKWATDHHIPAAPVLASYDDLRPQFAPTATYPRLILIDRNLRVIENNIFPQNDETIREKVEEAL